LPQVGGTTTTSIHRGQITVLAQAPCYTCILHAIAGPGQAPPAGPITHSHMCGSAEQCLRPLEPRQIAHRRYRLTRSPSLRTVTAPGRYFPFAGRAAVPTGPSRLPPLLVARAVSDSCSDVGRPLLRLPSPVVRRGLTAMAAVWQLYRLVEHSSGTTRDSRWSCAAVARGLLVDTPADPSP
jgi:hypothetical protein